MSATDIPTPIETTYRGVRFRSRLEARWAVFFHTLGIPWEYEPERFRQSDGQVYIPDFRLDGKVFVEVKPLGGDFGKSMFFSGPIILLEGPPGTNGNCFHARNAYGFDNDWVFVGQGDSDPYFFWAWGGLKSDIAGMLDFCDRVQNAIGVALSERFGAYPTGRSQYAERTRELREQERLTVWQRVDKYGVRSPDELADLCKLSVSQSDMSAVSGYVLHGEWNGESNTCVVCHNGTGCAIECGHRDFCDYRVAHERIYGESLERCECSVIRGVSDDERVVDLADGSDFVE